ncbi:MAG: type II toxin-antitoxin system prevent-host-death family antitoxin [Candidatus Limiplasma sp.]|nr:type II toxin-antitoxin system prevent-host-death family antitoxin [Candidatus Limiplasma sp.]
MQITATEFKNNIGKYLALASKQDIYITKNGKSVAKLSNPNADRVALLDSLVGILPAGSVTLEDVKKERLERQ